MGWCSHLRVGEDAGMQLASLVSNQGLWWGVCLLVVVVVAIRLVGRS